MSTDTIDEYLSENQSDIALEFISNRKQDVLQELRKFGLSEAEIRDSLEDWSSFFVSGRPVKYKGTRLLQIVAAGIHQCQSLADALSVSKSRDSVEETLIRMCAVFSELVTIAIEEEGVSAKNKCVDELKKDQESFYKSMANSYLLAKKNVNSKARKTRIKESNAVRNKIVDAYKTLKAENPKITQEKAADLIFSDPTKNGGRARSTILRKLHKLKKTDVQLE